MPQLFIDGSLKANNIPVLIHIVCAYAGVCVLLCLIRTTGAFSPHNMVDDVCNTAKD